MTFVRFTERADGWVVVHSDFDQQVVDAIKLISRSARRWDPETRTWRVRIEHCERLIDELMIDGHRFDWRVAPPPPAAPTIANFFGSED